MAGAGNIDDLVKDQEERENGTQGSGPSKSRPIDYVMGKPESDQDAKNDDSDSGRVPIGRVERFFGKINVVAIVLTGSLKLGDVIEIEDGEGTARFTVLSMQINKEDVAEASEGDSVGIKVDRPVRPGSKVYVISKVME